uniref:Secreted protein n=1 Tax=Rhabditophanes sp. KR3021 TaxID=114890 RepID=A0AC35U475_9BILA
MSFINISLLLVLAFASFGHSVHECYTCDGLCDCLSPKINLCPPSTKCYSILDKDNGKVMRMGCSVSCEVLHKGQDQCKDCMGDICSPLAVGSTADFSNCRKMGFITGFEEMKDHLNNELSRTPRDQGIGSGASFNSPGIGGGAQVGNPSIGNGAGYQGNGADSFGNGGIGNGANPSYQGNSGIGNGADPFGNGGIGYGSRVTARDIGSGVNAPGSGIGNGAVPYHHRNSATLEKSSNIFITLSFVVAAIFYGF